MADLFVIFVSSFFCYIIGFYIFNIIKVLILILRTKKEERKNIRFSGIEINLDVIFYAAIIATLFTSLYALGTE